MHVAMLANAGAPKPAVGRNTYRSPAARSFSFLFFRKLAEEIVEQGEMTLTCKGIFKPE
jgi:hypothetical protein